MYLFIVFWKEKNKRACKLYVLLIVLNEKLCVNEVYKFMNQFRIWYVFNVLPY